MKQVSLRLIDTWPLVDTIYVPRWEIWQTYVKNYRPHYTDIPTYRHAWLEK